MQTPTIIENKKGTSPWIWGYGGIALLELISTLFPADLKLLHYFAKPMLMVLLLVYVNQEGKQLRGARRIGVFLALVFSWMGDVFLMFEGATLFLMGLGSFLLAQLCYLGVFRLDHGVGSTQSEKRTYLFSVLLIAFGGLLVRSLWPYLGEMRIPVLVYAGVIMCMGLGALWRYHRISGPSFWRVMLGALLFILSDSLIAMSRFGQELLEIPYAGFWIMLTYILAQYLIISGILHGLTPQQDS